MLEILSKFLDSNEKQLKKLQPLVDQINALEPKIKKLSDEELRAKTDEFRKRLNGADVKSLALDKLLVEAFAVAREAIQRTVGERAFDVQLMAGIVLHQGKIAEQRTGEGKTHAAALALYLNSLSGQGCHLVTVNDYLARRDTGWYGRALHFLGLSVGCIIQEQKSFLFDPEYTDPTQTDDRLAHLRPVSRKEAYQADVTYGTNNEFGFDYLRDNMVQDLSQMVQRGHHFAIVDEVDFALIDEARTPLIISAPAEEAVEKYYDFAKLVKKLVSKTDYEVDEKARRVTLTEIGIQKIERWLGVENLYEKDFETIHHIEQALAADCSPPLFQKDRDYVVKDNQIILVDEFTGRLMFGRRYSEGLHQAIEAKEGVPIQRESKTMAAISFQNYFRTYEKLAGMTGTAATEAEEFEKIYGLDVIVIPTNEPMIRADHPDVVYKTEAAKLRAIVSEIEECHQKGQPVLVGTTSIEKNELLGKLLKRREIPHQILNAKNHEKEASIIAQAGRSGAVTVATNMAGRGVDIKLGGDKVIKFGGLYVVGTERHESRRIDNQLRGRSGRQGDPGSSRFFVSLQDDLMRIFGGEQVERLMDRFGLDENIPLEHAMVSKSIEQAQKRVEGHNFDIRRYLVERDDVVNKQREVVYRMRRKILQLGSEAAGQQDSDRRSEQRHSEFISESGILKQVQDDKLTKELWEEKEKEFGKEVWDQIVKQVSLQVIDTLWIEHLDTLEDLWQDANLRRYAEKDPLVEYKREAHTLFQRLMDGIWGTIADRLSKVEAVPRVPARARPLVFHRPEVERQKLTPFVRKRKVGRNDPCWCGSGRKFKRCHYPEQPV